MVSTGFFLILTEIFMILTSGVIRSGETDISCSHQTGVFPISTGIFCGFNWNFRDLNENVRDFSENFRDFKRIFR